MMDFGGIVDGARLRLHKMKAVRVMKAEAKLTETYLIIVEPVLDGVYLGGYPAKANRVSGSNNPQRKKSPKEKPTSCVTPVI